MRRYGLTPDDVAFMKQGQGYACAICRRKVTLVIDKDPSSQKVRGLLCHRCNSALKAYERGFPDTTPLEAYLRPSKVRAT